MQYSFFWCIERFCSEYHREFIAKPDRSPVSTDNPVCCAICGSTALWRRRITTKEHRAQP
jgi:hypothetical protein